MTGYMKLVDIVFILHLNGLYSFKIIHLANLKIICFNDFH